MYIKNKIIKYYTHELIITRWWPMVIKITLTLKIMTMFLKTTQKYQNMFLKTKFILWKFIISMISSSYLIFFF